MATDVIMPALGVAQETGKLLNWRKGEGDPIVKGEPLMEIETDKATVEIEAPASGILSHVSASAGDEIPVGQRIAVILAAGEKAPAPSPPPDIGAGAEPEGQDAPVIPAAPAPPEATPPASSNRSGIIPASPAARRIAREKGIDLSAVRGSGPDGAVLAADVLRPSTAVPTQTGAAAGKHIVPLTPMRRITGERMARSKQTAPHFYLTMDVDMTAIVRQRRRQ
jgi:pyruvate dehydrogenase E2 component (dihydrolipoamide acetyltransferase)